MLDFVVFPLFLLLVRLHMVNNVADFGRLQRALQAAQDLVGAPSALIHHELLGEAELA